MKQKLMALSLFTLLATMSAFSFWPQRLSVQIPFDYYVSGVEMPAGTYVINGHAQNKSVLIVRNTRGSAHVIVATRPNGVAAEGRSELLFHRYGNTYFLARVTNGASGIVRTLPVSEKEKEMAANGSVKLQELALIIETPAF